jgi:hypothetical protein
MSEGDKSMSKPRLRFVSLFVPNLAEAVERYEALLQTKPIYGASAALTPHPFAAAGPVVFQLGDVSLALYECDGHTTHPGDVGFGLETNLDEAAARMREQGGTIFWGPASSESGQTAAIGMLPDRHFFELVDPL